MLRTPNLKENSSEVIQQPSSDQPNGALQPWDANQVSSLNHTFFKLSPEILLLIVVEASKDRPLFPWIFSQVNSYCRQVATGAPTLWTSIDLFYDLGNEGVAFAKPLLAHSKTLPLDVRLVFLGRSVGLPGFVEFLGHLSESRHAERIRTLRCTLGDGKVIIGDGQAIIPLIRDTILSLELPLLETLDIDLAPQDQVDDIVELATPRSHRVKSLSFRYIPFSDYLPFCSTRLTSLAIQKTTIKLSDFILAIRAAPSLETIQIETSRLTEYPATLVTIPCAPLHDLSTLTLVMISVTHSRIIRHCLDAPQLSTLTYEAAASMLTRADAYIEDEKPDALVTHLVGVGQLQRLELKDCSRVGPGSWSALFFNLLAVECIKITSSHIKDESLEALANAGTCPALIELSLINEIRLTSAIVRHIVESRDTETRIQTIHMQGWDHLNVYPDNVRAVRERVDHLVLGVFGNPWEDNDDDEYGLSQVEPDLDLRYYEMEYESEESTYIDGLDSDGVMPSEADSESLEPVPQDPDHGPSSAVLEGFGSA